LFGIASMVLMICLAKKGEIVALVGLLVGILVFYSAMRALRRNR